MEFGWIFCGQNIIVLNEITTKLSPVPNKFLYGKVKNSVPIFFRGHDTISRWLTKLTHIFSTMVDPITIDNYNVIGGPMDRRFLMP
jgi:hypothetical protein